MPDIKESKTSTFTIYHDRCDPAAWTPANVLTLANFIITGNLQYAASLSRLGMQLVRSEHHEPLGGELEAFGYMLPGDCSEVFCDIEDIVDSGDVVDICQVYRGPTQYAVQIPTGDPDGNFDGYEYEVMDTESEAIELLESFQQDSADA